MLVGGKRLQAPFPTPSAATGRSLMKRRLQLPGGHVAHSAASFFRLTITWYSLRS